MTARVEVVAAVLLRQNAGASEFLLAQRPVGKVYAGYWEFPGGKVEAGESLHAALVRELHEELGIVVAHAEPWLSREYTYPHAHVRLKFFRVTAWQGEIMPLEHSGIVWTRIGTPPTVTPVLPANGPILRALELPSFYALSNAAENGVDGELARMQKGLGAGLRLIQIRDKTLPREERRRLASGAVALARAYPDARILINDDEALAEEAGAHGLHLSSSALRRLDRRPAFAWVGASCHDAEELALAAALELDFAVLGPVLPTASHPDAVGIGWSEFARLVERSPLPVFALGGMKTEMLAGACTHGAHGVALLRGWA